MGGAAPPQTQGARPPAEWPAEWGQGFREDPLSQCRGPFLGPRDKVSWHFNCFVLRWASASPPSRKGKVNRTARVGAAGHRGFGQPGAGGHVAANQTQGHRGLQGARKVFGEADVGNFVFFQKPEPLTPCLICSPHPRTHFFLFCCRCFHEANTLSFLSTDVRSPVCSRTAGEGHGGVGAPCSPRRRGDLNPLPQLLVLLCRAGSGGGVCALPPACCPPVQHECLFPQ